jgi:hypothetical protein
MEKVQKNSVNSVQHTPSSESFQVYLFIIIFYTVTPFNFYLKKSGMREQMNVSPPLAGAHETNTKHTHKHADTTFYWCFISDSGSTVLISGTPIGHVTEPVSVIPAPSNLNNEFP